MSVWIRRRVGPVMLSRIQYCRVFGLMKEGQTSISLMLTAIGPVEGGGKLLKLICDAVDEVIQYPASLDFPPYLMIKSGHGFGEICSFCSPGGTQVNTDRIRSGIFAADMIHERECVYVRKSQNLP